MSMDTIDLCLINVIIIIIIIKSVGADSIHAALIPQGSDLVLDDITQDSID